MMRRAGAGCNPVVGQPDRVLRKSHDDHRPSREGRLVLDEPTTLPEGTQVPLLPRNPGDWLDDTNRAALHTALQASEADVASGRLTDAAAGLAAFACLDRPPGSIYGHGQEHAAREQRWWLENRLAERPNDGGSAAG